MRLFYTVLFVLLPMKAMACSCAAPDLSSRIAGSHTVLVGTVADVYDLKYSTSQENDGYGYKARIVIDEVLKGLSEKEIFLYSGYGNGDCGLKFTISKKYVFFLTGGQNVNGCQGHIFDRGPMFKSFESQLKEVRGMIENDT